MNIRQLSCFVAVVDEGSFTRAARAIGIAQPSLSQHIRVGSGSLRAGPNEGNVQAVARVLFAHWALPFEATSVLLVVAVVGVMVVARRKMV